MWNVGSGWLGSLTTDDLLGTANEIAVTDNGDGTLTLSHADPVKFSAGIEITGNVLAGNGAQETPSFSFVGDPNTGVFLQTADTIGFASGGTFRAQINDKGLYMNLLGSAGSPVIRLLDPNSGIFSPGANIIALSTDGVERFRIAADGTISLGLTPNYTSIEPDGTLQFHGDGTVWTDYVTPLTRANFGGTANDPTLTKIGERAGNLAMDFSGNEHHGTLNGAPAWETGVFGDALHFGGAADYVDCGSNSLFDFTSGDFSVSMYVYFDTVVPAQRLISRSVASVNGWEIYSDAGRVYFRTNQDGVSQLTYTAGAAIVAAQWYHILVTRSGASATIYIDNVDSNSIANDHIDPATSSNKLVIGAYNNGTGSFFDGLIDEVRIYSKVLSAAEITALYTDNTGYDSLIAHWPLDGGASSAGVWGLVFSDGDEVLVTVQMPHSWKAGSRIFPHVHFTCLTDVDPADNWGLEFEWWWAEIHEDFPAETYLTTRDISTGVDSNIKHQLAYCLDDGIMPPSSGLSSILMGRIKRVAASADNYAGGVLIEDFDVHYELDTIGSRQELVK